MFSLKRDKVYYYQDQQQSTLPHFCLGCSIGQVNLYESLCHDVIHNNIILKSKQDAQLAEKVRTINVVDCGVMLQSLHS